MPLPRRTAARGRLATARIDAIIHALVEEDAVCKRSRFWGGGRGGEGSRCQLGNLGARLAGDAADGESGVVIMSESAIKAVIDFVDMDKSGDIDLKVLRIYVYIKVYVHTKIYQVE